MSVERRTTRQQRAVRSAILEAGRPLSIEEIHEEARASAPTIGLRTVYRVVRRLEEDREIAPVTLPGKPNRYESADVAATHHHHFHCESCDRVFDVRGCVSRLQQLLPTGFVLAGHELTFWGACEECSTARSTDGAEPGRSRGRQVDRA
ncbi:MAG: transcriptional repressor [Phycisphaeraceae bacterium]|nr:MAG: transcriptional repressor [Phycisphaeraceae bacterium]